MSDQRRVVGALLVAVLVVVARLAAFGRFRALVLKVRPAETFLAASNDIQM